MNYYADGFVGSMLADLDRNIATYVGRLTDGHTDPEAMMRYNQGIVRGLRMARELIVNKQGADPV